MTKHTRILGGALVALLASTAWAAAEDKTI